MNFSLLDIIIIIVYLIGIALFGILMGGKQKSTKDYFLSEKSIPWWAVCFAVVATETSALTFISIPGIAYTGNFNFLQLAIGYIIGRTVVSYFFLPKYFEGELLTAYSYLEKRFGARIKNFASSVFMITRVFADGVRLYATAIPIAIIMKGYNVFPEAADWQIYAISIIIIAIITMIYTYLGGIRAVIWTDVLQMFIYVGGGILAVIILSSKFTSGFDEILGTLSGKDKITMFNFNFTDNFFTKPYTFLGSVLGGMFLSMASHGTDQLIVQRILTTRSELGAKKALIMSGFLVLMQFALFLFIGSLLFVFFNAESMKSDEVFPRFIIHHMPSGVSGFIIAGLLAAAMSTLSGSISSLSSTLVADIYKPYFGKEKSEEELLRISKFVAFIWCIILILSAFIFMNSPQTVVELGLTIASFTYGGLLGTFLLGIFFSKARESNAIIGFVSAIIGMVFIIKFTPIAWTWFTLIGVCITILASYFSSLIIKVKTT